MRGAPNVARCSARLRIIISAPGRVCLFGEHMDWCGQYVIPAAIDMRVFTEASSSPGRIVEVHSFKPFQERASFDLNDIRIDTVSDLKYVSAVLKAMDASKSLPSKNALTLRLMKAGDVAKEPNIANSDRYFDDLPVRKGLSSSAALCVTVAGATDLTTRFSFSTSMKESSKRLLQSAIDHSLKKYANLAYIGERKILGVNCGQMDQYAAAYGGILFIDCRNELPKVNRFRFRKDIPLVIGDTRQQKDTPRILAWLGERFKKHEKLFMEGVDGIVKVALSARKELNKANPSLKKIGELMNLNQLYLSKNLRVSGDCPVSPSNLDKLLGAALNAGALGAKVTGSGGGGCIIALCESESQKREVAQAITNVGGRAFTTKIASTGLRLELVET